MSRGTVIRRGNGYSVVLDLGRGPDGKRIRKWHSGYPSRRAAERARVELLTRLDQGAYVEPSKLTVAAFLRDHWLPGLVLRTRRLEWIIDEGHAPGRCSAPSVVGGLHP